MSDKKKKKTSKKKLQYSGESLKEKSALQSSLEQSAPSVRSSHTATTSEQMINYSNPIPITPRFNNSFTSSSRNIKENLSLFSDQSRTNVQSASLKSLLNNILQKPNQLMKKNVIIILFNLLTIFKAETNYSKELIGFIDKKLNISTENTFQKINIKVKNLLWEFNKKQTKFDNIVLMYIAYSLIDFPVSNVSVENSLQKALNTYDNKKKITYRTVHDINLNIYRLFAEYVGINKKVSLNFSRNVLRYLKNTSFSRNSLQTTIHNILLQMKNSGVITKYQHDELKKKIDIFESNVLVNPDPDIETNLELNKISYTVQNEFDILYMINDLDYRQWSDTRISFMTTTSGKTASTPLKDTILEITPSASPIKPVNNSSQSVRSTIPIRLKTTQHRTSQPSQNIAVPQEQIVYTGARRAILTTPSPTGVQQTKQSDLGVGVPKINYKTPTEQIMRQNYTSSSRMGLPVDSTRFGSDISRFSQEPIRVQIVEQPLGEPYPSDDIDAEGRIKAPLYFKEPITVVPSIVDTGFRPYRKVLYLAHLSESIKHNINKSVSKKNLETSKKFNTTKFYKNKIGVPMFYFKRYTNDSEYILKKAKYKELYISEFSELTNTSFLTNPWILEFIFPALNLDAIPDSKISQSFRVYKDIVPPEWDITVDELDDLIRDSDFVQKFTDVFTKFVRFWGFRIEKTMLTGQIKYIKNENYQNKLELIMTNPNTYFKIFTRVLILLYAFQLTSYANGFLYSVLQKEFYSKNIARNTVFMHDCMQLWKGLNRISTIILPKNTRTQKLLKHTKRFVESFYKKVFYVLCAFAVYEVYRVSNHMGILPEDFILPGHIYKSFYDLHSDLPITFREYENFVNQLSDKDLQDISKIDLSGIQSIDYEQLLKEKGQISLESVPGYAGEKTVLGKFGRYVSKELVQYPKSLRQIYEKNNLMFIEDLTQESMLEEGENASSVKPKLNQLDIYSKLPRVLTIPLDVLSQDAEGIKSKFSFISNTYAAFKSMIGFGYRRNLKMIAGTENYNKSAALLKNKPQKAKTMMNMYYSYRNVFNPGKASKSKYVLLDKSIEDEIIKMMQQKLSSHMTENPLQYQMQIYGEKVLSPETLSPVLAIMNK